MKKRKEAFSFDDISEQLFKKQKEEIEKMSMIANSATIEGNSIHENNKKKTTKKPRKLKNNNNINNNNNTANHLIQNNQHSFTVFPESEINNPNVIVANPMSTMYEFETLHGLSNKKSTKDLLDESKEERSSLIITELTKLKKKETSSSFATKREPTGQKYQKKMDPEHGRFSRHDTLENDDNVKDFFKTEEELEQQKIKVDLSAFSTYEPDNILFRFLEEEEKRRNDIYRNDAQENASSMGQKMLSKEREEAQEQGPENEQDMLFEQQNEKNLEKYSEYFTQKNSKYFLEEVNREYCENFLREPIFSFERNCKREEKCVAKTMYIRHPDCVEDTPMARTIICREFLLPLQQEKFDKTKDLPIYRQACLLCKRLLTTYTYKKNEKENKEPLEIIQDHYNTVGVENGGYSLDSCLHPVANKNQKSGSKVTGIVRPIRRFSAADYIPSTQMIPNIEKDGELIEVRCFVETPLNFPIAPVVDLIIKQQTPSALTTDKPFLE